MLSSTTGASSSSPSVGRACACGQDALVSAREERPCARLTGHDETARTLRRPTRLPLRVELLHGAVFALLADAPLRSWTTRSTAHI
jgi:hypothetical protein